MESLVAVDSKANIVVSATNCIMFGKCRMTCSCNFFAYVRHRYLADVHTVNPDALRDFEILGSMAGPHAV